MLPKLDDEPRRCRHGTPARPDRRRPDSPRGGRSRWPLIRRGGEDDPGVRTELIHDLAAYGVPLRDVVDRLAFEKDVSARRALILSLGEYPLASVPEEIRRDVVERIRVLYVGDGDPGVHSAIDWLFRRKWDLSRELDSLEELGRGREFPLTENGSSTRRV